MSLTRFALFCFAAFAAACSVLFQLEDQQCSTNDDCRSRHGAFDGSYCIEGYCKALEQAPTCASNAECTGSELCLEHSCTKLTNAACPIVLGEANLRAESPIVFAILAAIDPIDADGTVDIQNYRLALDEFDRELPGGPGGQHPFAGLVCDSRQLATALGHVIQTVHVPAIVAELSSKDLATSFQTLGHDHGVFFLSPYDADSSLTTLPDDSLVWSMVGSSTDLGPVYTPLMARIEAHLALPGVPKVVLVESDQLFEIDLADSVADTMKIAGVTANASPGFSRHTISFDNPKLASDVVYKLLTEIQPDIVISAAGDEFVSTVLAPLELAWDAVSVKPHPFYVLSMENRFSPLLFDKVKAKPELQTRLVGVNYALPDDLTLYDGYVQRFQKAFPEAAAYDTAENFYDTMYYLLYAFAAAGNVGTYAGADVLHGWKRLLAGQKVDVGPQEIADGVAYLQVPSSQIALQGVLGPPDFDTGTGSRVSKGSVWCVNASAEPIDDVLRLDQENQLTGEFPCFDF